MVSIVYNHRDLCVVETDDMALLYEVARNSGFEIRKRHECIINAEVDEIELIAQGRNVQVVRDGQFLPWEAHISDDIYDLIEERSMYEGLA